jgi:cell division protease FtsH
MKVNYDELITKIHTRRARLARVAKNLKKKFIGIDSIIDSVIESINVWYIMPEIMQRPIIVCLWGLTGVGKTDLVRSLVKELEFSDRFVEVQLSNKGHYFYSTVEQYLRSSSIEPEIPGILLLDEIQRFRTKNGDGSEIHDCKFQDLWMLLSDGCFSSSSSAKQDMLELVYNNIYFKSDDDEDEEDEKDKKEKKYHRSFYSAQQLKEKLQLSETVEAIMRWSDSYKCDRVFQSLAANNTFEGKSYSRLLIFIAGNLDEAYAMSQNADDADQDADVFNRFSKKINLIDIKAALKQRFKPEQISRFGNDHIIYPSLSRKSYQRIIKKKVAEIIAKVKKEYDVVLKIDQTVYDCIYRNGVFPAQGVRPVLSTISTLVGNSIPTFILFALENKIREIYVEYENGYLISTLNGVEQKYFVECVIDNIKNKIDSSSRTLSSVHEAGHAVVYASLFNTAPTQIVARVSSSNVGGFVGFHDLVYSKTAILNRLVVNLAGHVAEEMVFGDMGKTAGASSDLERASSLASKYVRRWGFDAFAGVIQCPTQSNVSESSYDIVKTDEIIEKLIQEAKEKAILCIKEHKDLFIEVANVLVKEGAMKPEQFKRIASKFGLAINVVASNEKVCMDYTTLFEGFKNEEKDT